MPRYSAFRSIASGLAVAALVTGTCTLVTHAQRGSGLASAANAKANFGFPAGFSVTKMDPTADPRKDFTRYAAGRWFDVATIPSDSLQVSSFTLIIKTVEDQLQAILQQALRDSAGAPKGSPVQLVGDFFASGLDEKRLTDLGVTPLTAAFASIDAARTPRALAEVAARLQLMTTEPFVIGVQLGSDPADRTRNAIYAGDGDLPMATGNYLKPEAQAIRDGYVVYVTEMLQLAGQSPDQARVTAAKILALESRVARKKMSLVDRMDPNKRFVKTSYADFKRLQSNFDLDAFFATLGLPPGGDVILVEVEAQRERNAMLAELPWSETQAYLKWELLRLTAGYLSPAFAAPLRTFNERIVGKTDEPSRREVVASKVPKMLGHPLSRLFVERHFSADTRRIVEELVGRVRAEFRGRIVRNTWLAPATRAAALEKLDKVDIRVGYPTTWIDYSGVEIRRDDYFGNVVRLNTFTARRGLAKFGQPAKEDEFAMPGKTLAIDINAAYDSGKNGIEIPAAFLQPPFFDPKADPAVNYCTIGAVIGHELTHGFDSTGRNYDALGRVRDWWTGVDARRFAAETEKLVTQANRFEALPGVRLNGALEVGENLADTGGVALGYHALQAYLREHPEAAKPTDGFSPAQRCFLAWGQLWAEKTNEGALRQNLPVDGHPPGPYRIFAPAQHEKGFYDAFGIRAGDPMWLDEKARVVLW